MDRRNSKSTIAAADTRRTQEAELFETDARNRSNHRTVTVTTSQKVVTRRSAANGSTFNYELELCDTTPKTDYTYSRSRSYVKQPINENYVSPNMSRQGLRRSTPPAHLANEYSSNSLEYRKSTGSTELSSDVKRNLSLEKCFSGGGGEERGGGMGDHASVALKSTAHQVSQGSRSTAGDTYMTLRSRTLSLNQQTTTGGWREDNTFEMRNMHGTDIEEEFSEIDQNHSSGEKLRSVVHNSSLRNQVSWFLFTVIQVCVTVVTYLPRTAASKTSAILSKLSSAVTRSQSLSEATTHQQTTVTTETTETIVSTSTWQNCKRAVSSVLAFLLVTLPVGLVSWAVFGLFSVANIIRQSVEKCWHLVERCLYATVTKTSRIVDSAVLSKTSSLRRRCGCLCVFPCLFLLPLLLIALLYASSCQDSVAVVGSIGSEALNKFSAFFLPLFKRESENTKEVPVVVTSEDASRTDGSGGRDENILLAMAEMEERWREMFAMLAADHRATARDDQNRALSAFRSDLDRLIRMIVRREINLQQNIYNVQIDSVKATTSKDQANLLLEQKKQMEMIVAFRESLNDLEAKTKILSEDLGRVQKNLAENSEKPPSKLPATDDRLILDLSKQLKQLNADFVLLQSKHDQLAMQISERPMPDAQLVALIRTEIQKHLALAMSSDSSASAAVEGEGSRAQNGTIPFGIWLRQQFASQNDVDDKLSVFASGMTKQLNEKIVASKEDPSKIAAAVAAIIAESNLKKETSEGEPDGSSSTVVIGSAGGGLSDASRSCVLCDGMLTKEDVLKLIQIELGIYDADKTGKVDYALESAGGSIISVRCSETYQLRTAQTSIFGIPLWYTYNSPRVIIQPGVQPGECWAFTGIQGYVVLQLARKIFVTEVSIEHIPKSLAPTGRIDSAPKDCELWGLESETDNVGVPLGNFTYSDDGPSLQTFQVQNPSTTSFRYVELRINSNHGQEKYTCLYRLRVHGYLDPASV